jgi:hypothetical protein
MPLPTLVQLPYMAVLSPLGLAAVAGPISTSVFGAATIPVLGRLGRRCGLSEALTALLVGLYAFNPAVVFWCGSGMSEPMSFFLISVACLAYLTWTKDRSISQLGLLGVALGFATLTRYENVPVFVVFAVAVAIQSPRGRRLATGLVVAVPSLFALFVWMAVLKVLRGDPLIFYKLYKQDGTPPRDASWLPQERTIGSVLDYVVPRSILLAPLLLLLVPIVFGTEIVETARRRRPAPTTIVLLGVAAVYPANIAYLLLENHTFGNLRYFASAIVLTVIAAIWLVREGSRLGTRRWRTAMVGGLALMAVTATAAEADRGYTYVESEWYAFGRVAGSETEAPQDLVAATNIGTWRGITSYLDAHTTSDDLIAMDTASGTKSFTISLWTRHPERFVIAEDRDFEQLVALDAPPFTYIVAERAGVRASRLQKCLDRRCRPPPEHRFSARRPPLAPWEPTFPSPTASMPSGPATEWRHRSWPPSLPSAPATALTARRAASCNSGRRRPPSSVSTRRSRPSPSTRPLAASPTCGRVSTTSELRWTPTGRRCAS